MSGRVVIFFFIIGLGLPNLDDGANIGPNSPVRLPVIMHGYYDSHRVLPLADGIDLFTKLAASGGANSSISSIKIFGDERVDYFAVGSTGDDGHPTWRTLPVKLGRRKHVHTISETTYEYNFTFDPDAVEQSLVLKLRDQNERTEYSAAISLTMEGELLVICCSSKVETTTRRIFRRTLPPAILGYYENVAERESSNFPSFAKTLPLPPGVDWSADTRLFIGKKGDTYFFRYIVHEAFDFCFPFRLNEIFNVTIHGIPLQYSYTLNPTDQRSGGDPNRVTLEVEFKAPSGKVFHMTAVLDGNGMESIYTSETMTAFRYWQRRLPPVIYGTYQLDSLFHQNANKEPSRNDDPLNIRSRPKSSFTEKTVKIQFSRTERGDLFYGRQTAERELQPLAPPFHDTSLYFVDSAAGGERVIIKESEHGSETKVYSFDDAGLDVISHRTGGNVTLTVRAFFRRKLPHEIIGSFECLAVGKEYRELIDVLGIMDIMGGIIVVEFAKVNEKTYRQSFRGSHANQTVSLWFVLGKEQSQVIQGRTIKFTYQLINDGQPILRTTIKASEKGSASEFEVRVANIFTRNGFNATYTHAGRVAVQEFRRLGDPTLAVTPLKLRHPT
ncbi:hypothetical protein BV898_01511 [Hypsibius exemplaris]|uniref:Uncharacterized protein n=1 Tax=Hypsibius exemplaris TaxID=2072580 RepID=A0A1W0XA97_HYPEX|nr:hypothetical protein BV898_01511 [Hypsibius exemplaris]